MKHKPKVLSFITLVVVCAAIVLTAQSQSKDKPQGVAAPRAALLPLELNKKLPLTLDSHPVEWKNYTYHLLRLGSIQFDLDKPTGHLKAEIQGSTTSFDQVDYDVSVAVFDANGALLGTAKSECKVERIWLGNTLTSVAKLDLDFGISLDYAQASQFTVGISRRTVLTPDQWQK
jgi:hypothetical protein